MHKKDSDYQARTLIICSFSKLIIQIYLSLSSTEKEEREKELMLKQLDSKLVP